MNIKKRKQSLGWKIIIFFFFLIVLLAVINAVLICRYSRKSEIRKVDGAIVLGASVWGEQPSPVFKERIHHGIWLYKNQYVDCLIFTGGYSEGQSVSDAAVARRYAVEQGVPEADIFIEEKSRITEENLYYAKILMENKGIESALIVSDPLHMKRAMKMAEDLNMEAYTAPTPTTRYTGMAEKTKFLLREVFFYSGYQLSRIGKTN